MEKQVSKETLSKSKPFFEDLVKRRFIYNQSFEIYGGVKGLYDYGPVGCAIKNNMFSIWREHFVIADDMLEISCPSLTPYVVLKNSGHVDRFTDVLVKDVKTQDPFRADHLLEDYIAKTLKDPKANAELKKELEELRPKVEEMKVPDFKEVFKKYKIKSPETGNELSEAEDFNLMFKTQIGPWSDSQAFLRPETAQSLITNFQRLYEFNNTKLPFAAANIGLGFRNEISPRQGLIRVREFEMGEIEHFVDPLDKSHPKYGQVTDVEVTFFPAKEQLSGGQARKLKISEALSTKVLSNETMAYFIARVYQYMKLVGIKEEGVRFRQHKPKEMAHYASDCWDCELMTSYGWVESVGIADRSAYDLECHSKGIKKPIVAARRLDKPREENQVKIVLNKGELAKKHQKDGALIFEHFENMNNDEKTAFKALVEGDKEYKFTEGEKEFVIKKADVVEFKVTKVNVIEEKFVPGIIEPAFGFGRILYALLEQNFHMRDEKRTMLILPPSISPIKCSILPHMAKDELLKFVPQIENALKKVGLSTKVDKTGLAIGRRYARTDEIGVPFAVTIDYDTVAKGLVTLREALSMKQVQLPIDDVAPLLKALCQNETSWDDVLKKYPLYEGVLDEEDKKDEKEKPKKEKKDKTEAKKPEEQPAPAPADK